MLNQFMKEKSHSNVTPAITIVFSNIKWINMLKKIMKEETLILEFFFEISFMSVLEIKKLLNCPNKTDSFFFLYFSLCFLQYPYIAKYGLRSMLWHFCANGVENLLLWDIATWCFYTDLLDSGHDKWLQSQNKTRYVCSEHGWRLNQVYKYCTSGIKHKQLKPWGQLQVTGYKTVF